MAVASHDQPGSGLRATKKNRPLNVDSLRQVRSLLAMIIDLRKDAAFLRDMPVRCVLRYSTAAAGKVGKPFHPPVTRLDFVYTLGDGTSIPYVCLQLDTKEGSEPDGNPTHKLYDYA